MVKQRFLFLILMLLCNLAVAMPNDRDKLMTLTADRADLNQHTHRGTFDGHVQIDQGTTHLRANNAITEGDQHNKLVMAVAKGSKDKPAHCWTQTAADKPLLHAYADTIRYYPDRHLIELIGNASVKQGKNSFAAAKISYDTLKQHVLSQSNTTSRTKIVIYPDKQASKKI